jgi:hypothetical protein
MYYTFVSDCLTNRRDRRIIEAYCSVTTRCWGLGHLSLPKDTASAFDYVRNYFRPRSRMGEFVSLSERRQLFVNRVQQLQSIFQAAFRNDRFGKSAAIAYACRHWSSHRRHFLSLNLP